ncbi:NAD-P-binding protein [Stereum hirsutum FP-91666 SS1]|uniref:NAD-P-binding protein n=1 Tax=Stereum hirsutum (strain FP-91666) TaxID=721885 RepID=UPI0004449524|nr:NAD-P-binding protein [Stereum hirsutum FP-91666 SS1]EIM85955.1 NAD-P-binding protein [Stereum hirsutum FP-91666 SS1]
MPAVVPPARALVTGANGFIAVWVVHTLLERGYFVRGTIRSESKGVYLKKLFEQYGDKFECVVVEDITKEGAFDEAVKDIDIIEHTASPVPFNTDKPDEVIIPAIKGTVGILESAKKYGKSVRRVIVTGSCASVVHAGYTTPVTYDETSWNEPVIVNVQQKGVNDTTSIYMASKTLAEKAAWEYVKNNASEINYDLTVLNPPWVLGPVLQEVTDLSSLNVSMQYAYDILVKGTMDETMLTTNSNCWVDVRDVGLAHVLAAEKPSAGGERIILCAGQFFWQDFLDAANSIEPPILPNLPKGKPGATKGLPPDIVYITSKSDRILGLSYRSAEEMIRDTLINFKKLGAGV